MMDVGCWTPGYLRADDRPTDRPTARPSTQLTCVGLRQEVGIATRVCLRPCPPPAKAVDVDVDVDVGPSAIGFCARDDRLPAL